MSEADSTNNGLAWYRSPWLVVALYLILTGVSALFALKVEQDYTVENFVSEDDPDRDYNREVVAEFGGDELIVIGVEAPDVFTPEVLRAVEDLTAGMESMPGVTRVVSLFTVNKLEGEDGFLDSDLLVPWIPETEPEIEAIRTVALNDPLLRGEVVGSDGRATAINAFVDPSLLGHSYLESISEYVDALIREVERDLPAEVEIYAVGNPLVINTIRLSMESDLQILVPIAVVAIALILLIIFRSLVFALVPLVTGCVSILPTIAFMHVMGFALDPITSIVPLLILVIGSTEDTHLLTEYRRGRRKGKARDAAIESMFDHAGTAVLLTSFTTAVGFATLVISDIPALRSFGLVSAFGIVFNYIVTVHLLPAILRVLPAGSPLPSSDPEEPDRGRHHHPISLMAQQVTVRRRGWVLFFGVAALLVCAEGFRRVGVDTDFVRVLHPETDIRQGLDKIGEDLAGPHFFRVVVETPEPDGILQSEYLSELDKIDRYLSSRFDKTLSVSQFIRKVNVEMNDGDTGHDHIPDDDNLIAQYALLLNQEDLSRVVDFDYQQAVIIVRAQSGSSAYLTAEKNAFESYVESEIRDDLVVRMTGRVLQAANSANEITAGIRVNIGIMLGVIVATIALLFMSLRAGLLSLIPNVLPILAVFGVMGWIGLPLSIFTFSVVVIGLGIAVDDTIHLLSRYYQQLREVSSPESAMKRTISAEFLPISSTSIALTCGFLILTFSSFATTVEFGFLSAVSIVAAFFGDMFFAPSLLYRTPIVSSWVFLSMKFDVRKATEQGLFKNLSKGELKRVAALAQIRKVPAGGAIVQKGDRGRDLFLILEGQADVYLSAADGSKPLASLDEGDVVGEMAFLLDEPRSADVVARTRVRILRINEATLHRVTDKFPRTATKLYRNIAYVLGERLQASNEARSSPQGQS